MAWLSRFAKLIERMVTSLDGNHPLEDEDASGLWMSTADALQAPPVAPLPAALPADLPPELPGEARGVQLPVAPEAPPREASREEPAFKSPKPAGEALAPEEIARLPGSDAPPEEIETQPADAVPAETAEQTIAVEHIAAPAGSAEDMLSMFRESSSSSEYSDLTKEIDDITARELLEEARAVLGLLTPQRAPSEEDAIA